MSIDRYIRYFRKSSESEERQQASIPAQERELGELVARRQLQLAGEPIRETMSAKRPGRPLFNSMIESLEQRRAEGIVCWHLDRLARNPLDGGRVIWAVGEGVIREIVTPGRTYTNTAEDKLMMAIEFGMSTKYVDDLSQNVARGQRQSLEAGRWPGTPKLGYVRACGAHGAACAPGSHTGPHRHAEMVPDPERFGHFREVWQLKLQGYTVDEILRRARREWKLSTRPRGRVGGKLISRTALYRILRDPFYAGVMKFGAETARGHHQPMVTWDEFQQVQTSLTRGKTHTPKGTIPFSYRGLLACGSCGAMVTAERHTSRYGKPYTYYHCCRKSRNYLFCPEPSLQEHEVDAQLDVFLSGLILPDDIRQEVELLLPALATTAEQERGKTAQRAQEYIAEKQRQLQRLRELCVGGHISTEELAQDRERILGDIGSLEASLQQTDPPALIETFRRSWSLVNEAVFVFRNGDANEKRALVRALSSKLLLKDKKLLCVAKTPFAEMAELKNIPGVWAIEDSNLGPRHYQ